MRRFRFPILAALLITSCSAGDEEAPRFAADDCLRLRRTAEDQLRVRSVNVAPAPEGNANVILKVTSNAESLERLRIEFDGVRALDVELPGSLGCSHPPVFTFGFDIPEGVLNVRVATGDDMSEKRFEVPREGTRWLVVQTYEELPLDTNVWIEEPQFG